MTKKVTLDKTEYDEMEKEIERLKEINTELVKGASVVIEPKISFRTKFVNGYLLGGEHPFRDIYTDKRSLPNNKSIQEQWEDMEDKIRRELNDYIQQELDKLDQEEWKRNKDLERREQDFKNTRRASLKNQENERKRLKEEYDKKAALFEKQKQWYKDRPIKRYVLAGALLALAGNYILGLL